MDAPTKSKVPLFQAASKNPSAKGREDGEHMLPLYVPQGTGGADAISIAKRAVRAWKNGEEYSIKISTSQRSDKHRGTELLPCSGEGAEESSACSTPLRGADGSPKQPRTSGGTGRVSAGAPHRPACR